MEHVSDYITKATAPELMEAAKRASDTVNLHLTAKGFDEVKHYVIAFKLADGTSDGTLYESKLDAVRHQADERLCAYFYFRNALGGTSPRDMAIFLQFNRDAYDAGMRLTDPDAPMGGADPLITTGWNDHYTGLMLRGRLGNKLRGIR